MLKLLYKELTLSAHPNLYVFMFMGALLLVPDYPFGVVFLFGMLGPYITVFYDRETRDTYFTVLLPIRKRDAVTGKCLLFAAAQLTALVFSVPFAMLRTLLYDGNAAGIEANAAYYGFGLIIFGVYNFIFLTQYYKTAYKAGQSFIIAALPAVLLIALMEVSAHIPSLAWLDGLDTASLIRQLPILAAGVIVYPASMLLACRTAQRRFERVDL